MARLIFFLLFTLVVFPILAVKYDVPMTDAQWVLLKDLFLIMTGIASLCFVVSELTKNYSQTDKLWGIAPIIYVCYAAWVGDFSPRLMLMAGLVLLWGLRLSYNFSRRGGFSWIPWKGEEDYRWAILQDIPLFKGHPWRWRLFNLFFISFYQHTLICLICLPVVIAYGEEAPLNLLDGITAAIIIGFLIMETLADQQQFTFQNEKHRLIAAGENLEGDYARGFRTSGLFAWMRHPNYTAEQAIWVCFYFFGVAATDRWINWTLVGALLLILLFRGSSDFGEKISSGKYPDYEAYQKQVGRFLPKLGGRSASKQPQSAKA